MHALVTAPTLHFPAGVCPQPLTITVSDFNIVIGSFGAVSFYRDKRAFTLASNILRPVSRALPDAPSFSRLFRVFFDFHYKVSFKNFNLKI